MGLFNQMAVKEQLRARVAFCGPTGSGKTWSAAQWAVILAGGPMSQGGAPIGFVDTENRSAAYYAPTPGKTVERLQPWDPPYEFFHFPVRPPYDPRELARIIDSAEDDLGTDGVLVIDSLTAYWSGEGGTMDIVDDAKSRNGGNSFAGWKEGTPAQRLMLDKIIHAPFHIIITMRSKMEYILVERQSNGRTTSVPTKVGMAPEQRGGVEYEFTVVADMDLEHRLTISKSRCDEIADKVAPKGRSAEIGVVFAEWLGTGVNRIDDKMVAELAGLFDDPGVSKDDRVALKTAFVETFGKPVELLTDRYDAAVTWTMDRVARLKGEPVPVHTRVDEPAAEPAPAAAPEVPASLQRLEAAMAHDPGCPSITEPGNDCTCTTEPMFDEPVTGVPS